MKDAWPPAVERVAATLRDARVEARVHEFSAGTPTAENAATAVGCNLSQIVKSLVFRCDSRFLLVMVPGDRRADRTKIATAAGCERLRTAGPEDVARITGFEPGGVAPFPLPEVEVVLVEHSLLVHDLVWVGAGSRRHMAALAPPDLVRLTRARAVDAVSDNSE
ncbi:MAG: YbaK/EbsC family protein [Actinomycetota bacterium]|nr:YbaK/EbsC family protein [Actinomycetota bacterium]